MMILIKVFIYLNKKHKEMVVVMELSFPKQIMTVLQCIFSSFLTIELLIVFLVIYLFFHFNQTIQNKKIPYLICGLLLFILCFIYFLFQQDIHQVLFEIVKVAMQCFYFPNIIFYFASVICCFISLVVSVQLPLTTWHKRGNLIILLFIIFLFTIFSTICYQQNISFTSPEAIYSSQTLFSIVHLSQCLFLFFWVWQLILSFCHKHSIHLSNLKKDKTSAIIRKK